MQWIKASERLPDKEGRYCVKRLGEPMVVDARKDKDGKMYFAIPNGMAWKGWKEFEWLDESPDDKDRLEKKVKYSEKVAYDTSVKNANLMGEIERLKRLIEDKFKLDRRYLYTSVGATDYEQEIENDWQQFKTDNNL